MSSGLKLPRKRLSFPHDFPVAFFAGYDEPIWRLEAENTALRQQLIVLRRKVKGRPRLTNGDRWFLVFLYRLFPSILGVAFVIRPETLNPVASIRFSALLALEVAAASAPAENR